MITLTEAATNKIQKLLSTRGGVGVRLGVRTTGCSGLAYVLEYVDRPAPDDQCFNCQGCSLFLDPKSSVYLTGMTVDYVRNGLNEGFEFRNPNEKDRCGCGESFRV
jgi:iron-sulfur cluster assembly protein